MSPLISRRTFVATAATGAMAAALPPRLRAASVAEPRPPVWPGYDRAIVIDALATPGPFNVPNMFAAPWTSEMLDNARASGITAVNVTVNAFAFTGAAAFDGTVRALGFLQRELATHPDVLLAVRSATDITRAKASARLGLIAGFQDGAMLEGDATRVDLFHDLGVRIIQLTYNTRNLLGDGCLEPANAGLSALGRDMVARMNARGILVDLSHCGEQTTTDAIQASARPVAVTHSGCRALADVPRNKTDAQLKLLADKGGVIGIYLMPFLRVIGQPDAGDVLRHIDHAVNVCGEDHVGIGSDNSITPLNLTPEYRRTHAEFIRARRAQGISAPGETEDVFTYVPDFNAPRRLEQIADALASRGYPSARIEKIIGGNFQRLFADVW